MPYITQNKRDWLDANLKDPKNAGELNYVLTKIVHGYLGSNPNYQQFNDAMGALEGAKLELYRRKVAPYEDIKIEENGDV